MRASGACTLVIPSKLRKASNIILRSFAGRFDAARLLQGQLAAASASPNIGYTAAAMVGAMLLPLLLVALFALLAFLAPFGHFSSSGTLLMGATGYSSSASTVSTLAELYKKTNTDVKIAIKLLTEEAKWFRDYPKEQIEVSGNENRVPLILTQPVAPAMIPDGGSESVMESPAPTKGTFLPVQMNRRFGYTGLAAALGARARAGMIQEQTAYQAMMAAYSFARAVGLQTYGSTTGTVAVVKTTGSPGTVQNGIALKNAYGSATLCPGGTTAQDTYLSSLVRKNDHIALIRAGAIVEFATVNAAPSAGSGVGFIDATFTSSITPTANDLIVLANADGDSTITGTDKDNWPIGFTDALLASSVLGVTTASFPAWAAGSASTVSQRLSFSVKEKMVNDIWNAGGVKANRFIMSQGVRRDAIAGELGARRYNSADTDIEGDLSAGDGEKFFTSQLAIPNALICWFNQAYTKIELSDLPDENGGKQIFKLDKVQGKSQIAAAYDYFYARIPSSRAAMGYAANLTES